MSIENAINRLKAEAPAGCLNKPPMCIWLVAASNNAFMGVVKARTAGQAAALAIYKYGADATNLQNLGEDFDAQTQYEQPQG